MGKDDSVRAERHIMIRCQNHKKRICTMAFFRYSITLLFLYALLFSSVNAGSADKYSRTFWNPLFHGQRLDYCASWNKNCGIPVANQYCQMMGYKNADQQIIDYNVGLTKYLSTPKSKPCKGFGCNGFMLIRCVGEYAHKPVSSYYYRSQAFVFPRFNHSRIDWCYKDGKGCGKQAAHSFCRRMGYMRAQHYKMQSNVSETRALGNHKLCLGVSCKAFSSITCYR